MKEKIPYIFITLLAILCGFLSYELLTNECETKEKTEKQAQEPIVFKNIESLDDKIIEHFDITLNGKSKTIDVDFEYRFVNDSIHVVSAGIKDTLIYSREYYENGNQIKKEDVFNEDIIKRTFTVANFDIIAGSDDKDYLIAYYTGPLESSLKIFADDMTLISKDLVKPDPVHEGFVISYFYNNICELEKGNPFYPNTFDSDNSKKIHVKKEKDKIYFLAPVLNADFSGNDFGTLEERVYTVRDNKLEYDVINKYKIKNVCQQAW